MWLLSLIDVEMLDIHAIHDKISLQKFQNSMWKLVPLDGDIKSIRAERISYLATSLG